MCLDEDEGSKCKLRKLEIFNVEHSCSKLVGYAIVYVCGYSSSGPSTSQYQKSCHIINPSRVLGQPAVVLFHVRLTTS